MRKILLLAVIALLCLPMSIQADSKKNNTESDEQIQVDLKQYDEFAAKYHLLVSCGRGDVGEPWYARLYRFHKNDDKFERWEEEGYPTLAAAIKTVERDYLTYPEGHAGHF